MMDELLARFSSALTPEMFPNAVTTEAQNSFERYMATQSKSIAVLPPDSNTEESTLDPTNLDITDPAPRADVLGSLTNSISKLRFAPPENLPCANVQVQQYKACDKQGSMACSSCKLVSYCSKASSIRFRSTQKF